MRYIKSKELGTLLDKIKNNQELAEKTLNIITQYQGMHLFDLPSTVFWAGLLSVPWLIGDGR